MFEVESWAVNKTADKLSQQLFTKKRNLEEHHDLQLNSRKQIKLDKTQNSKKRKHTYLDEDPGLNTSTKLQKTSQRNNKKLNDNISKNETDKKSGNTKKHLTKHTKMKIETKTKSPRNKYKHLALKKPEMKLNENSESKTEDSEKLPDEVCSSRPEKITKNKRKGQTKDAGSSTTNPEVKRKRLPLADKQSTVDKKTKNVSTTSSPVKENKRKRKRKKKNNPKNNKYRHLIQKVSSVEAGEGLQELRTTESKLEVDTKSTPVIKETQSGEVKKSALSRPKRKLDKDNESGQADDIKLPKRTKSECSLKERMNLKLNSARFRYLNEKLYTQTGVESLELFKDDKEAFEVYHTGFQSQVLKWPSHPLDTIIKYINTRSPSLTVADFGCGDANLAQSVPNKVHSFDFVALNKFVTPCDMSKVPLPDQSVDVAVFCLSLMGTNLVDYLKEANRVLKIRGILKVAEVCSRFRSLQNFIEQLKPLGFTLLHQNTSNKMFVLLDFKKTSKPLGSTPQLNLLPCVYKKR